MPTKPSPTVNWFTVGRGLALTLTCAVLSACGTASALTDSGPHHVGTVRSRSASAAGSGASVHSRNTASTRPAIPTRAFVNVRRTRASASVGKLEFVAETLYNCGPAAISEVLAYWHVYRSQAQIAAVVRADNSSFGMAPFEVPAYARSLGLRAIVGPRGNQHMIKALISNGIPVIVNQLFSSSYRQLHYRALEGYSDATGSYVSVDTYLGRISISFAGFRSLWQVRDRRFIIIYPPSKQTVVSAILKASGWGYQRAYTKDLAWFRPQLNSPEINTPGTWLNYNGYVEAAWAADQAGRYRLAGSYLHKAADTGERPVLMRWIRLNMAARIKSGIR